MLTPKKHGFTVVELLVVIVVIGILAAITIASYLWLNRDAQAAHTVVNANQYIKSLDTYKSKFGQYPVTATFACVGSYPAITGSPANACYSVNGGNSSSPTSTAAFNSEMQKVGLQPTVFTNSVSYTSGSYTYVMRGLRYSSNGRQYQLWWYFQGTRECGVPGASRTANTIQDYTYCTITVS